MIADDLQQTLERYLSGAMSSDETRSFLARADVDQELRRLLDAERVITGAVARDLAATAPAATVPGDGLLAALEISRTGAAAAAGSWMTMKVAAIGVAIGLAGLIGGALFVAPIVTEDHSTPAARTASPAPVETPSVTPQPDVETGAAATSASPADARAVERNAQPAHRPSSAGANGSVPSVSTSARTPASASASAPKTVGIDERSPESLPSYDDQKVPVEIQLQKENKR